MALVRSLTFYLLEAKHLTPTELEMIRHDALAELSAGYGQLFEQARRLVRAQYP